MSEGGGDYRTSVDRVGLALACGAALAGLTACLLVAIGGESSARAALVALLFGGIFAALAITAIAGPIWLVLHLSGRRGPAAAAISGAGTGFLLMLAADLGSGSAASWRHILGAALLAASLAGGVALAMWRVAYRLPD